MINLVLFFAILICAIQSIHSKKLIPSAIWLAGASAILSILIFKMGANQVAVIELSVGAGLVTVLLIFAIGVAGEEATSASPIIPRALIIGLIFAFVFLLGIFIFPPGSTKSPQPEPPLTTILWNERGLDILTQIVLIFAGVLGLLGLLAEAKPPLEQPMADEFIARRQEGLAALERESEQPTLERSLLGEGGGLEQQDTIKEVSHP
jgi:NADH:ubiquinone oxidoreductase subunit 6 (subunit J)